MKTRTIEVTVKLTVPVDTNSDEVVSEMDYNFTYNGVELGSEIMEAKER